MRARVSLSWGGAIFCCACGQTTCAPLRVAVVAPCANLLARVSLAAHALAPAAAHCALPPARRLLSVADAKKVEPRHRLISSDLGGTKKTRSRKQWKELKKKKRVTWGTGRREAARMAKKAAAA